MQKTTNHAFFDLVAETTDLEKLFGVKILHGVGLCLDRLVSGGDYGAIHNLTNTGHFSVNAHPWEMLILGTIKKSMQYLEHLMLRMSCWVGDAGDVELDEYPVPLMIGALIRRTSNVEHLWKYESIAVQASNTKNNPQKLFETWCNRQRTGKSHILMVKKFHTPGFSVDDVIQSASSMLELSVCCQSCVFCHKFLVIRPMHQE